MAENIIVQRWKQFIQTDASSGIILVLAAVLALIMANSFFSQSYNDFLEFPVSITLGTFAISKPLVLWVNDGLMALFFFVVGLEIKRELFYGQLSRPDQVVLPFLAAIAGIICPALIYVAFNYQDAVAMNGWAIPSATDIAFALGIFILFGKYLPPSLKLFLLSVAIIDDIGAIIIIAIFYSQELATNSLIIAGIGLVTLFIFNRLKLENKAPYILLSIIVWAAVLKSGVHATLAGFAVAWFIPIAREKSQSMSYQIEHGLHPWIAFFVLPLFAFANAGVGLTGVSVNELFTPISIGIIGGLFIGKQLGIFAACVIAVKLKLCRLPKDATWTQLYGVCLLCGVGFTMSLFIGSLAFEEQGLAYQTQVKVGVLVGSLISAVAGAWLISRSSNKLTVTKGQKNEKFKTSNT
ncbi:Na+/H+ antiporter NhaA [Colwellia sp. MB02u-10]|jgi:NhaA family Na+:H+ antiporter|uniref:Na+/H+ antiporter NhaA n=1 Tax=Colwellia sp. MB02u-10 TaxID=2759828 RepID=UPI0015F38D0B|nr:Na+/H+ antiporter NhaA [Colwellia sp. MB02u-10]MBA6342027.1 Na+/H+ antiporter NhaA [Colwellia sp. MB02u-10]